jgi:UDP-galactopyranose mutase
MDILCFSHLRWNFVFQRPQHLMVRFADHGRVFFIEEATFDAERPSLDVSEPRRNVFVCVPRLPPGTEPATVDGLVTELVDGLVAEKGLDTYLNWFYTPMMLPLSKNLRPAAVVYDCMDQLSAFKNAPSELQVREHDLFKTADLVYTGGRSLFEAKKNDHPAIYAFPSSIDKSHFSKARDITSDIPEQAEIPHPRIGFVGVIDERADLDLLAQVADRCQNMNFIMVGPVVKIDAESLPQRSNIHYLGQKSYDDLPAILAGWDVAMMPFALNESTRYISPTKTPEYLAAGLSVVSTPIADVVDPYGNAGLVRIAATAEEFCSSLEESLSDNSAERNKKADEFLHELSWDTTFESMRTLINKAIDKKASKPLAAVN